MSLSSLYSINRQTSYCTVGCSTLGSFLFLLLLDKTRWQFYVQSKTHKFSQASLLFKWCATVLKKNANMYISMDIEDGYYPVSYNINLWLNVCLWSDICTLKRANQQLLYPLIHMCFYTGWCVPCWATVVGSWWVTACQARVISGLTMCRVQAQRLI